jgi:hypothetical protein
LDTAERHRQIETLDSPGFFYSWHVNVRRGSVLTVTRLLSGAGWDSDLGSDRKRALLYA